jgi:hypothetical protein
MAGYSGTPLWKKLGIKPGTALYADGAPANYRQLLEPLPEGVTILRRLSGPAALVHLFCRDAKALADKLATYRDRIAPDGTLWVSWPKKASGVPTDVTEDVIRDAALPLGLVDTKVCAVDDVWSGLKLVLRLEHRPRGS